ncbi:Putative beta-lactamase HcpC precursor [Pelagimonas phthalicica]|uniref:Putative beta-lactamase HcpC n=1 Tax=Pelagimonas phthalicica TaxID=1037362 RepID=A0A238JEC5_9RHOB|nr:tetratricopeptide repeat protein [Pelagimonas phthalicica]TDS91694.1 Sel1 repeat-containing protein [Pelagimonas phthalicica]SMX28743.1 Putative beta-lactamase HcpC precursor [Pelagimonas phthalicica]
MRILTSLFFLLPGLAMAEMSPELADARQSYLSGDYSEIWGVVQAEAEAGDPVAQNMLGAALTTHDGSKGLDYDPEQGLAWYEKAADQGFDKAVYNMALFWQTDHKGFTADYNRSRALAEKATEMGYIHAPNLIADMLYTGKGGPVDHAAAFEHYSRAAEMGSYVGLRAVGYAYFHGEGVTRDVEQVRHFLDLAVAAGDTRSIPDLAYLYEGDQGIPADPLRAYTLYRYGVDRGNAKAAFWLASFSVDERFEGVWRDAIKGYGYCLHALTLGYAADGAEADCQAMADALGDKEIARGQAFAKSLQ